MPCKPTNKEKEIDKQKCKRKINKAQKLKGKEIKKNILIVECLVGGS